MNNPTLSSVAPAFTQQLQAALRSANEHDLAESLAAISISHCTYDTEADAGYIYLLAQPQPFPAIHNESARVRRTISFFNEHGVNIDVDHECYLFGIEWISRPDLIATLKSVGLV